ncbi:DUF6088 family protein [Providencia vermicola]|uniref:DUF6088 family protein n=1 Tax=Providencia vermicola TaxID=333965 RepID=UPI001CEC3FC7|nr:DUF6088 family protein [Providencia vermicola]
MFLKQKLLRSIANRKGTVILRSELEHLGSKSQIGKVLAALVKEGIIIRVSLGVYAKTRFNRFAGKRTVAAPFESVVEETFQKLNVQVTQGQALEDYNAGKTTQIPMQLQIRTPGRKISRNITVSGKNVQYEKNYGRPNC